MSTPRIVPGTVAPAIAEEFPGLSIASLRVAGAPGRSAPGVRARLDALASRIGGAQALALREGDIGHAHRVFFRHVGLDPDVVRTPVEAAVVRRLVDGGFATQDRVADACLLAVVETGVGVWAMDASDVAAAEAALTVRPEGEGEGVRPGRLLVADADGLVAVVFDEVRPERRPTPESTHVRLFAIRVPGVAAVVADEALWIAAEAVAAGET